MGIEDRTQQKKETAIENAYEKKVETPESEKEMPAEIPQKHRGPEAIQSDIASTDDSIAAEQASLNEARARLGLPPSETSVALDSLRAKRERLLNEQQIGREAVQETPFVEATTEAHAKNLETENELSWKQVYDTPSGKEFSNAMRGVIDGKQDATRSRITNNYSMREFVRKNPKEAEQFKRIFQKEFGRPHSDLERAYSEINELRQNPPAVSPDDPNYAELADKIDNDTEYQKLREELETQHKMSVFGTTDFKTIPLDRFTELINTDVNFKFSSDRETEKAFRRKFPEKTALYDKREKTRVYRDPDGMINRDRDPLFLEIFEPNSRGEALAYDEGLRQFALKYPEKARGYAEKYADLQKFIKNEQIPKETSEKPRQTEAYKLSEIFERAGMESKAVKIENGGEFSEAIIFDKKDVPAEKLVRLYRGVNHLDVSVLEQVPYAMRTESATGKPIALEQVRQEVDALAHNPTYENLTAYADKVRPHLQPDEARRFDEDLARIEDGILGGYSTRKELAMRQIEHGGGWGDSGISPYISSSLDPYEAAGYGREGLMVLDVPLSQIENFGIDTTETNIKGALDKKYITAILPRRREGEKEEKQLRQEISRALQKVYESAPASRYSGEELRAEREKKFAEETRSDAEQWKKDVEAVRQKRAANLVRKFREVKLETHNAAEQGVDVYTKAKRDIFDFYKARLKNIGRNGRNIEDYDYQEREHGERKKFDREKADDTMLLKLKVLVEQLEQREEERSRRK